jgi:hypothetical protein
MPDAMLREEHTAGPGGCMVIYAYKSGESPEQIVEDFDTLKLADVYSVIGYYPRHQSEVDAYLREAEAEAEAIRRRIESQPGYHEFREHLLARRAAMHERPG